MSTLADKVNTLCTKNAEKRFKALEDELRATIRKHLDFSGEVSGSRRIKDRIIEIIHTVENYPFIMKEFEEYEINNFERKFSELFSYIDAASKREEE